MFTTISTHQKVNYYLKQGNNMNNLPELNKALDQLQTNDIEALKSLALSFDKLGMQDQADLVWEQISDIQEEQEDILLAMQEIKDANY